MLEPKRFGFLPEAVGWDGMEVSSGDRIQQVPTGRMFDE
jgi:hypothetical protein